MELEQGLYDSIESIRRKLRWNIVLFVGAPLSGKGTQANLLSDLLSIPSTSSGDIFRKEVASGSALGQRMKSYMDKGELIPNDLTTQLLTQSFADPAYTAGLFLDGYPRNLSHLEIFDRILASLDRKLLVVIHFDVPKETLLGRLEGRLTCAQCAEIFNALLVGPSFTTCTKCNGPVLKRPDDNQSVFERRFEIYQRETLPLLEALRQRGLVITLQSAERPHTLTQQILSILSDTEDKPLEGTLSSYAWLHSQWSHPRYAQESERRQFLTRFRDKALQENLHNRSGQMRRFIYLKTTNPHKFKEHVDIFTGFYGIEIIRIPPEIPGDFVKGLLLCRREDLVPLAVIREESNLFRPNSEEYSSLTHGVRAMNRSVLWCYVLKDGELTEKIYEYNTFGVIDLNRRVMFFNPGDVFGWDDIFVVENSHLSYHQLRQYGIKRSSRDMVISDYLRDNIHYKQFLDAGFNKQSPHRVIDFTLSVSDFVENNVYYNNPLAIQYGFRNLQNHVLNFGVFFRAAKNRRQNNYWNPGLNGGIPLTKKRDEIHELTFMAHDFGHFAIPDLIFVGTNSLKHRRAYIAWRMASEATTMALADMLFVDSLNKTGVQYDFTTRRIYPLFLDLGIDFLKKESYVNDLKVVIKANFEYCLTGDDGIYRELLKKNSKDTTNLELFEEKFMPFFVEDFRWTEQNYDNMMKRADEMRRWWDSIKAIRELKYLNLKSLDEFVQDLDHLDDSDDRQFISQVFERVFEDKIRPVLENKVELLPEATRLQRAFTRYMAGQLAIFSKFHFIPESKSYQDKIIKLLIDNEQGMNIENVSQIRGIYEQFLQILVEKNLLSKDDQATYSELYPLFDPYYVSYDRSFESYENLSTISKRIFSLQNHREKQFAQIERTIGRVITDTEKKFISNISLMIEESNGQIQDGLFVIKPGVLLLGDTHWVNTSHPFHSSENLVTFLISGISLETSLELIAHKEARVARLTSSKTLAMNVPLFRVQGMDNWPQRKYIEEVLKQRVKFENSYQPRKNWEDGNEIFNISMPGCKVTALCYSMTLKDFHSLFIGRMGPQGNELEVREIVRMMANQLHARYPQFILTPEDYLSFNNSEKYRTQTKSLSQQIEKNENIAFLAETKIDKQALKLFKNLNIPGEPHHLGLSEFRSRITYLAFPKAPETLQESQNYINKMTSEFHHYSVVAGFQVVVSVPALVSESTLSLFKRFATLEKTENGFLITMTLKDMHQMFVQWALTKTDEEMFQYFVSESHKRYPFIINKSY